MNRRLLIVLAGGIIAGAVLTALVFLIHKPAPNPPVIDAITFEETARWQYDKDSIWIGNLTISADHPALPYTAPGVSAKIRNDTEDRMIVALFVVLLDEDGRLIASACLSPPPPGIIGPGESKTVSTWLPVSSGNIADVRYVKLRVTRAAVHPMPGVQNSL